MPMLRSVFAMLVVSVVALIMALPWEAGAAHHFLLPMLTYCFIHAFGDVRPGNMPHGFVFLIGLGTDILKAGPLGYWGLIYLTGILVSRLLLPAPVSPVGDSPVGLLHRWLVLAISLGAMAGCAWGVASIYFLTLVDWRPIAVGFGGAWLAFPLVTGLAGRRPDVTPRGSGYQR